METFREFRGWLISFVIAIALGLGGYLVKAQASSLDQVIERQNQHAERIAKLEAIEKSQERMNERLERLLLVIIERK